MICNVLIKNEKNEYRPNRERCLKFKGAGDSMHGNPRGHPLLTCHADSLSNMVPCFLISRQQAHMASSNSQLLHI